MRITVVLLLLLSGIIPAHASAIGPVCKATVTIEERAPEYLIGRLTGENCAGYNGMTVEIRDGLHTIPFHYVTHLVVDVQPFSAMGPNGPVEGHQGKIVDIGISNDVEISRISTDTLIFKIFDKGSD